MFSSVFLKVEGWTAFHEGTTVNENNKEDYSEYLEKVPVTGQRAHRNISIQMTVKSGQALKMPLILRGLMDF